MNNQHKQISSPKNPTTATLLSLFTLGGGQIYLGQTLKGITIILVAIFTSSLIFPVILLSILGAIDAHKLTKRQREFGSIGQWEFFFSKRPDSAWKLKSYTPAGIEHKFLGTQIFKIDNNSASTIKRSVSAEREYTKTYSIEHEKIRSNINLVEPSVTNLSIISSQIEQIVRTKHAVTKSEKLIHKESVEIDVPAYQSIEIQLSWQSIIQKYEAQFMDQFGKTVFVSFSVTTGVTFDHSQMDNKKTIVIE